MTQDSRENPDWPDDNEDNCQNCAELESECECRDLSDCCKEDVIDIFCTVCGFECEPLGFSKAERDHSPI